mgnify:CR=1 FL=1
MRYKREYNNIDPCPADNINRSLLIQEGFLGLNFRWYLNKTVATSDIPIGIPGWPELAFWTASIDKNLIALDNSLSFIFTY